ncbi:MAG: hypothetical protein Q9166_008227 [cf. Caloplaca sp. 2 TL-2023]
MADFRARLKPLFRRSSTATTTSSKSSASSSTTALGQRRGHSKSSLLLSKQRKGSLPDPVHEEEPPIPLPPGSILRPDTQSINNNDPPQTPDTSFDTPRITPLEKPNPILTLEEPTPDLTPAIPDKDPIPEPAIAPADTLSPTTTSRPIALPRRQSLTNNAQSRFLETLLETDKPATDPGTSGYFESGPMTVSARMLHRKIWVKRPDQSATMVTIIEDDLVDDARDMILKKYANSLGRYFDAPDVTLRISPRDSSHRHGKGSQARTLGPEEQLSRTLDAYYPGGQHVDEALIIDIPRRTPRHSPHISMQYYRGDDLRPSESGKDYFPTVPVQGQQSPRLPSTLPVGTGAGPSHPALPRSMGILGNGQATTLPSPGQVGMRHAHSGMRLSRPGYPRRDTASPKVLGLTKTTTHDSLKSQSATAPAPPPLPSPQLPSEGQPIIDHTATPPRVASPLPGKVVKKPKKAANNNPKLPAGLLDGAVPPINVLIVEDNIINLKLLEAFMKRLKVRWHTAMNGKEAVNKWRQGGFHLVLMDIQLPVMNGLDATKEIRRLEGLNKIGVFSNSTASTPTLANSIEALGGGGENKEAGAPAGEDSLMNTALFKSPVIIVALTASSLQSDRHEALAAGCNDFLTKPVNFVWLERKVMEWGCMQALIDFDGWRKWKDFSQTPQPNAASGKQPSPSGKAAISPSTAKDTAGGANETPVKGKKSLAVNTGGGKKEKRLSSSGEMGSSGSGSEGSGNGSTVIAGA